jgi:glycosyltransferase involved in cell wall biosynthesis
MMDLSIVIPLLNESTLVNELTRRVKLNVEKITPNYEIILIDDGSKDNTWRSITEESKVESKIKGIKLSRNFGHHYAITAGLNHAIGDWVVVMDGDLQDRPEVIPELFQKAKEGFDVVFVSRQNRPENLLYIALQKLFYALLRWFSGIEFDSSQANYSIISKKVVEAFKIFPEHARFYGSTIIWLGFQRGTLVADHGMRFSGKSSYTIKKRFKLAFDIIISFSEKPLRIAIIFGIFTSIISMVIAGWIFTKSFTVGYAVNGWASIIVTMFFLAGVLLIFLGILGIYIGETFKQVKNRPLYIIDELINK